MRFAFLLGSLMTSALFVGCVDDQSAAPSHQVAAPTAPHAPTHPVTPPPPPSKIIEPPIYRGPPPELPFGMRANVEETTRVLSGPMPEDFVHRLVRRHLHELHHCYEIELAYDLELHGTSIYRFEIRNGAVNALALSGGESWSNHVNSCVESAVGTWTFPVLAEPTRVELELRFAPSMGGGGAAPDPMQGGPGIS